MQTFTASRVDVLSQHDLDYGEGWIAFTWPDPLYGEERLTIQFDGFCSKANPFYSGYGLESVLLERIKVSLRFSEELSQTLELDQEVIIVCELSDKDYAGLFAAFDMVGVLRES
jgi:hypothetical protein